MKQINLHKQARWNVTPLFPEIWKPRDYNFIGAEEHVSSELYMWWKGPLLVDLEIVFTPCVSGNNRNHSIGSVAKYKWNESIEKKSRE
jgi:hypothetical protein